MKKNRFTNLALLGCLFTAGVCQAQKFAAPVTNPFGLSGLPYVMNGVNAPVFVDIDGDGDQDLMCYNATKNYVLYENTGNKTAPIFSSEVKDPFGLAAVGQVIKFADMDADGDYDVLRSGISLMGAATLEYLENTGSALKPVFAAPVSAPWGITLAFEFSTVFYPVDIDDDGDQDIMGFGDLMVKYQYYENTGSKTKPVFGAHKVNPFGLDESFSMFNDRHFVDLDNDGDEDYFYSPLNLPTSFVFQSHNATKFDAKQVDPFNLVAPSTANSFYFAFADLNDDGDQDLLVTHNLDRKFLYYENKPDVTNISESGVGNSFKVQLYPNPVVSNVTVNTGVNSAVSYKVFNCLGAEVQSGGLSNKLNTINVESLEKGLYFIQFTSIDQQTVKSFIKE